MYEPEKSIPINDTCQIIFGADSLHGDTPHLLRGIQVTDTPCGRMTCLKLDTANLWLFPLEDFYEEDMNDKLYLSMVEMDFPDSQFGRRD